MLTSVKKPIEEELNTFNTYLRQEFTSRLTLLDDILQHLIKQQGKQLRPIFMLLSAKALGTINDKTYKMSLLVEMLHTASLVHDDVVDNSALRRGKPTINALWDNRTAVLAGDYILAQALQLSSEIDIPSTLPSLTQVVCTMGEGEFLQLEKNRQLSTQESDYLKIISQKTAALISLCCKLGAISVSAKEEYQQQITEFGQLIGIAFQICDDILDFSDDHKVGKITGNDIREQKLTLPTIYYLQDCDKDTKEMILSNIRKAANEQASLEKVLNTIRHSQAMDRARNTMKHYVNKALEQLEDLPQSEALQSLRLLAQYCIDRDH